MINDTKKICGVCQSTFWYSASILVFVLVAVATALAKGGDRPIQAIRFGPIASVVADKDNPAPSITLHYVGAKWCGPCHRVKPILERLKKDGYNIKVYDIDEDPDAPKPSQGKVPYFKWDRFHKTVSEDTGFMDEKQLIEKFEELEGSVFD